MRGECLGAAHQLNPSHPRGLMINNAQFHYIRHRVMVADLSFSSHESHDCAETARSLAPSYYVNRAYDAIFAPQGNGKGCL